MLTGRKGKCPEPYTREEVFEERFAAVLKALTFDQEALVCVRRALLEGHRDEKRYHAEVVAKLQREHRHLQERLYRAGAYPVRSKHMGTPTNPTSRTVSGYSN